ncbi:high mobility group protein [Acanthamoeba castellanii medusavirus]|uniref:High mobility group protein n=1 Tax=Acanthamoeba castellanii medusavirus J1 TaxID=3114988 RepID=A0A3T1CWU9_9VIRU|nr:high mobility group protein [Acanthamoeba castellanii medusavirus]BBI30289.1 high mobility group protein [Acanthamoeba castellanii medusavirus J1]
MARVVKKKSATKKAAPAKKAAVAKKRTTKKAAAAGPKRPLSAYMYFSKAKRPALVKANPDWAFGAYGQELGRLWAEIGTAAKKPFEELAKKDKRRYEREMGRA